MVAADLRTKLISLGVKISNVSGGCCGNSNHNTTAYSLPMRLDVDILPFLTDFGTPSPSFTKTSLLKIYNKQLAITGVRKMSQIRYVVRDKDGETLRDKFEEKLIEYVEWYNKK